MLSEEDKKALSAKRARERRLGRRKRTEYTTQAERIIDKFGGVMKLVRLLNQIDPENTITPSSVYRWNYPTNKYGTGGIIPIKHIPNILKAARLEGIFIDVNELYPTGTERRGSYE